MNKLIVIGDIHIDKKHFGELESTFKEILNFGESKYAVFLGDIFHNHKATPEEINFALKWFRTFTGTYKEIVIVEGNHDVYAGYSTNNLLSYIPNVYASSSSSPDLSLSLVPIGNILFCHKFVAESEYNFSAKTKSIKEMLVSNPFYVFLGHQHNYQQLAKNACHLGSIRYTSFLEYTDPLIPKKIAILDNNYNLTFKNLTSPTPLKQFKSIEELKNYYKDVKKNELIGDKIRLLYDNFNTYKNDIDKIANLPFYFKHEIKLKLDFENRNIVKNYNTSIQPSQFLFKDILIKWLNNIEDNDIKTILEEETKTLCD
jgi:DNA repair exonuclease SbcCD nuclease subunit